MCRQVHCIAQSHSCGQAGSGGPESSPFADYRGCTHCCCLSGVFALGISVPRHPTGMSVFWRWEENAMCHGSLQTSPPKVPFSVEHLFTGVRVCWIHGWVRVQSPVPACVEARGWRQTSSLVVSLPYCLRQGFFLSFPPSHLSSFFTVFY